MSLYIYFIINYCFIYFIYFIIIYYYYYHYLWRTKRWILVTAAAVVEEIIKNEEDNHMGVFNQPLATNGRETVSSKLGTLGSIFNMFNLGDQLEHRSALRYDQKILNAFSPHLVVHGQNGQRVYCPGRIY